MRALRDFLQVDSLPGDSSAARRPSGFAARRPLAGRRIHWALGLVSVASFAVLGTSACGDDEATGEPDGGGAASNGGNGTGNAPGEGICLLHNCEIDEHCSACSEGRTTCLEEEKRCVACDADTGTGCADGQYCSSFGKCVPEGVTCPTDPTGTPQITCASSADCVACSPAHQVCNTATGQCVACTENDTAECQSTDICVDNQCTAACSAECQTDNDCMFCPSAKACKAHKCSECSDTYACPAGQVCKPNGTCQQQCGLQGAGSCNVNADCAGCESAPICNTPINGGLGTCGPDATGCSDLGPGTLALPAPWNQYTNTCSTDANCAGVGAVYNIGEALRDLTGIDSIQDANITYPMSVCAAVTVAGNSCGLCVPCRIDSDCQDIDIEGTAAEAFGAVGSLAAALLLDLVFGPNEHKVFMYCETVAAGYGVCAPCPGLLNDCAVGGGGGTGSGNCDHPPETAGGPLDPTCGSCEAAVCGVDPYCCNTEWDSVCVGEVAEYCSATCAHGTCEAGAALSPSCDSCAAAVCAQDPYCCDTTQGQWDSICVSEVADFCSAPCP